MGGSRSCLPYPESVNSGAARVWRERYELIDLVARVGPSNLWRAYDNRLRRTVGLQTQSTSLAGAHGQGFAARIS